MRHALILALLLAANPAPAQQATINPSNGGLGWRTDTGQQPDVTAPMTWVVPYYGHFLCLPWPVGMAPWPYIGP